MGIDFRVDHDQLIVSGPSRHVGALLDEIADVESEIVAALQLVDGALAAETDPAAPQGLGPQAETLLRAELVALIGEVSVLLGETSRPAAVQAHALREPLHAIPANLAFFRDCASSLRAARATLAFVGALQLQSLGP
ncbi:hypothetical protein CF70_021205 [Cupriavidus sp. SK-3]|uniref:hypothetical protein n=1 Tax=Cupriavidus sp. SK-3 TaxID=1470558 RepID=UPI0004A58B6B|nr:hypothetical protein [Cupriavidus sp. SK-3]KDP84213.1 hypothetical protein CF70_021205 [Cupriavidus sp. SK-3]